MNVLPFHDHADHAAAVPHVARHFEGGGLLAYPTETVYGLGSRPVQEDLAALAALKGRPPRKPFLLLVGARGMAEACDLVFSSAANALADAFWPGPLTLILPGGQRLPDALRGPEGGIAVRWTSHEGMAHLIRELGTPVTSTSANRPGGPTAPGVGAILATFAEPVERGELLVLDDGVLGNVPPSTLLDCTDTFPRLVREGAIPLAELQRTAGSFAP